MVSGAQQRVGNEEANGLESVLALLVGPLGVSPAELSAEENGWDPLFRAAWGGRAGCVRTPHLLRPA